MPSRLGTITLLTIISCCINSQQLHADQTTEIYNQLFGQKVKDAQASRDFDDNLEVANELIQTTSTLEKQPDFASLLLQKAYELTRIRPDGYSTAANALELQIQFNPQNTEKTLNQLIALRQRQAAFGNAEDKKQAREHLISVLVKLGDHYMQANKEDKALIHFRRANGIAKSSNSPQTNTVTKKLDSATHLARIRLNINRLVIQLDNNPNQPDAANQLVMLYTIDLDKPSAAIAYAPYTKNKELISNITNAAKLINEVDETTAVNLGDWYTTLYEQTDSPQAKANMLQRSNQYYQRFLNLHSMQDLNRKRVQIMLAKNQTQLKELAATATIRTTQTKFDLLKMIDPKKHATKARWIMEDDRLSLITREDQAQIMIPKEANQDYRVEVEFTRDSGYDVVMVNLPLKDHSVGIMLSGFRGTIHGLHTVDKKDANKNETTTGPGTIINNQRYSLEAEVKFGSRDTVAIAVILNKKQIIKWQGKISRLDADRYAVPTPKYFGITSNRCLLQIHKFNLTLIPAN